MTIEEMQQAKRQAESQIREALTDFMRKTGRAVRQVEFTLIEHGGLSGPPSHLPGEVRLDVRM